MTSFSDYEPDEDQERSKRRSIRKIKDIFVPSNYFVTDYLFYIAIFVFCSVFFVFFSPIIRLFAILKFWAPG